MSDANVTITAEADTFLRDRLWGTLATTRSAGAPQVSMVAYDWNGHDVVISCRGSAAKFVNASRRPDVVFTVVDDIDCCTITGVATCQVTGVERDEATVRVRDRLRNDAEWGAAMLDSDIEAGLDSVHRVTITVVPTKVTLVRPRG